MTAYKNISAFLNAAIIASGIALPSTSFALETSFETCSGAERTNGLVEAEHRDLGAGVVYFELGDDLSGRVLTSYLEVVLCESGTALNTWATPNTKDIRNVRGLVFHLAGQKQRYSLQSVEQLIQDHGFKTQTYTYLDENCACAVAYPELRGTKTQYEASK